MKITFDAAIDLARDEFDTLRNSVGDKTAFDRAVDWMRKSRFTANLDTGTVRNRDGVRSQFLTYDWADNYAIHPEHIFFDFFRGELMNKYTRFVRGIDHA